jgi:energy-coupling factor transporter transmembrane protein EcfT
MLPSAVLLSLRPVPKTAAILLSLHLANLISDHQVRIVFVFVIVIVIVIVFVFGVRGIVFVFVYGFGFVFVFVFVIVIVFVFVFVFGVRRESLSRREHEHDHDHDHESLSHRNPRALASRGSQLLAPAALIHTHPAQNLAALHRLTVAPIAVGADGSSPRSPPLDCSKEFWTFYS